MRTFRLKTEYITLGQLLKAAGFVQSGVEAKFAIQDGEASVNGEVDIRRGRKLYAGDVVRFNGQEIRVTGAKASE